MRLVVGTLTVSYLLPIALCDTIFNTFGTGQNYGTHAAWMIGYPVQQQVAAPFTPLGSYTLDELAVALYWCGGPNTATVYITTAPGAPPIESFTFTNIFGGGYGEIRVAASEIHPELKRGTQYWIVMTTQMDSIDYTYVGWWVNDEGYRDTIYWSRNLEPWTPYPHQNPTALPVFRVLGTPVPEPSLLLPLGVALVAGLYAFRLVPCRAHGHKGLPERWRRRGGARPAWAVRSYSPDD